MRFAYRIHKFTDTHLEYVTLTAFPRQQWLRKRVSILHYTYVTCLLTLAPQLHLFSKYCGLCLPNGFFDLGILVYV